MPCLNECDTRLTLNRLLLLLSLVLLLFPLQMVRCHVLKSVIVMKCLLSAHIPHYLVYNTDVIGKFKYNPGNET